MIHYICTTEHGEMSNLKVAYVVFLGHFLLPAFIYKTLPRKCLIGRIEINNEVNNDWRSCKKEPLAIQSVIIVLTSWLLDTCLCESFAKSSYLSINPFLHLDIHIFEKPNSPDFLSLRRVILHLTSIKDVWWPWKSVNHDNFKCRPSQDRKSTL